MRISSSAVFQKSIANLQERKRKLDEVQEHISGEKRVLHASDDPVAAARAERARAQIADNEAQERSLQASRNAMTQADTALGNATNLLTEARETIMTAGNPALSDVDRKNLATKLQSVRGQLLTLANQNDGAGNFIFGGQGSSTPPFVEVTNMVSGVPVTRVDFQGIQGEQQVAGSEALPLTVDGASAWLKVTADGNGFFKTSNVNSTTAYVNAGSVTDPATFFTNTSPPVVANPSTLKYEVRFTAPAVAGNPVEYAVYKDGSALTSTQPWVSTNSSKTLQFDGMSFSISGAPAANDSFEVRLSQHPQSVYLFDTLDQAIKDLNTSGRTNAQVMQTVQNGLAGLDRSFETVTAMRTRVGEALVHTDDAEQRIGTAKYQAQVVRSEAEDLDTVSAAVELQQQNTNYEVALKAYSMVQKLSIFNYISS